MIVADENQIFFARRHVECAAASVREADLLLIAFCIEEVNNRTAGGICIVSKNHVSILTFAGTAHCDFAIAEDYSVIVSLVRLNCSKDVSRTTKAGIDTAAIISFITFERDIFFIGAAASEIKFICAAFAHIE